MGYWRWTNTGVLDGWANRKSLRECDVLYDAMWNAQDTPKTMRQANLCLWIGQGIIA